MAAAAAVLAIGTQRVGIRAKEPLVSEMPGSRRELGVVGHGGPGDLVSPQIVAETELAPGRGGRRPTCYKPCTRNKAMFVGSSPRSTTYDNYIARTRPPSAGLRRTMASAEL